jgi:hypothetical protein
MFQRNMLSPSSGAEVTRQGKYRAYIGPEERAEERNSMRGREYGKWMWTNREPSGRLQGGGWVGRGIRSGSI